MASKNIDISVKLCKLFWNSCFFRLRASGGRRTKKKDYTNGGRRPALSCVAARVPRRKVSVQKVEKTLFVWTIALVVGLLMSRLAKLVHLPAVTAYLVGGLLIGPFCLGALNLPYIGFNSLEQVEGLSVITQTALGFIAFAIGNEFRVSQLKNDG